MNLSFSLFFHLIGFGIIATSLLGGWIVERRIRKEADIATKSALTRANRTIGLLTPGAAALILITGIFNIYSLYPLRPFEWMSQGWLVAKVILFAFLLVNGAVFGPMISRRRNRLLKDMQEGKTPEDAQDTLRILSKNLTTFYLVQSLLLFVIIFLSVFGASHQ